MDEAILHDLSRSMGGRFRLAALVQKRLVQHIIDRHETVTKNSGGRPIRLVVEQVSTGRIGLTGPEGEDLTLEE